MPCASRTNPATFSPMTMLVAVKLPDVARGKTDASAIRRLSTPYTLVANVVSQQANAGKAVLTAESSAKEEILHMFRRVAAHIIDRCWIGEMHLPLGLRHRSRKQRHRKSMCQREFSRKIRSRLETLQVERRPI